MKLPTIDTPKYSVTVPSTGKKVDFRPFLVKEEKVLMIAQESGNEKQMIKSIRDVITACTFGEVTEKIMTNFDMEYIFLKLRGKSVGEDAEISVKCKHCEALNKLNINIDSIEVTVDKDLPKTIMLSDTVGITPRFIPAKAMDQIVGKKSQAAIFSEVIIAGIENIFDENEVYPIADTPRKDIDEFIDNLSREQMKKIEDWIDRCPHVEKDISFKCTECGKDNKETIKGVQNFFS